MKLRDVVTFAAIGSGVSILFLMVVNYLTSPNYIWFLYPSFVLVLWPISLYFLRKGKYKVYSLFVGIVAIFFLSTINYTHTPEHPWILYAIFPIILWITLAFLGKNGQKVSAALIGSGCTILYYSLLNLFLWPQYPWAIYPAYVVLWWPLILYFVRRKRYFELSIFSTLLTIILFITVNAVSSPDTIWAVYPIFAVLWWPLSMYHYGLKRRKV